MLCYSYCHFNRLFLRLGSFAHPNASVGHATFSVRIRIRRRNGHFNGRNSLHRSQSDTRWENQRLHIASA